MSADPVPRLHLPDPAEPDAKPGQPDPIAGPVLTIPLAELLRYFDVKLVPKHQPPAGDGLTDAEADCLEVLGLEGQRMTAAQVLGALRRAGKVHGDSTVIQALAGLCRRRGMLTNRTAGKADAYGSGYGLAAWEGQG